MAQQTAVEWLLEQIRINKLTFYKEGDNKIPITLTGKDIVEQAKQMEREQKIGLLNWMNEVSKVEPMRLETDHDDIVDQYYNETYGNNQNK